MSFHACFDGKDISEFCYGSNTPVQTHNAYYQ